MEGREGEGERERERRWLADRRYLSPTHIQPSRQCIISALGSVQCSSPTPVAPSWPLQDEHAVESHPALSGVALPLFVPSGSIALPVLLSLPPVPPPCSLHPNTEGGAGQQVCRTAKVGCTATRVSFAAAPSPLTMFLFSAFPPYLALSAL